MKNNRLFIRLISVPLMLLSILILDLLNTPNPMILLIILVVYLTYIDGYISGILSGSCAIIYNAYFFILKINDPRGMGKVTNIAISVTIIILLVGRLKAKEEKTLRKIMEMNESMTIMATTDKVTGATNRHTFFGAASTIYEKSIESNIFLSLFFIDIDKFKDVNDNYGHAFGDLVLARLSEITKQCLREKDLSCRYGGDEFVILLVSSSCDGTRKVADRIMNKIRQTRFTQYPDFTFTVSMGIACGVPTRENSLEDWIATADNAMYRAKEGGRDQFVLEVIEGIQYSLT